MKKRNNHISDVGLSKYFDGEMTASEQQEIEEHLNQCSYCRSRLHQFQQLHALTQQSADPKPEQDLWVPIENKIDLLNEGVSNSLTYKKWLAGAAVLLIVLVGGWWMVEQSLTGVEPDTATTPYVNQFAFDYGLYLSGLQNPETMKRFNEGYKRHKVELASMAEPTIPGGDTAFLNTLPQGFSIESAYLLESACCQCNQYILEHNGRHITVFQQPKKHPAEFTGFHKKHAKIDSTDCSKVETDSHVAYTFDSGDSKYVVVGKQQDPMVPRIMNQLAKKHQP